MAGDTNDPIFRSASTVELSPKEPPVFVRGLNTPSLKVDDVDEIDEDVRKAAMSCVQQKMDERQILTMLLKGRDEVQTALAKCLAMASAYPDGEIEELLK